MIIKIIHIPEMSVDTVTFPEILMDPLPSVYPSMYQQTLNIILVE